MLNFAEFSEEGNKYPMEVTKNTGAHSHMKPLDSTFLISQDITRAEKPARTLHKFCEYEQDILGICGFGHNGDKEETEK